jgi:hypothetical protein
MTAWDRLTPEQAAVMIAASEEVFLVNIMDEWRARQRWAETGSMHTPSDLSGLDKERLIGRFSSVVLDLAGRGWLNIEEHALPLVGGAPHDALTDRGRWISTLDGVHRLIMLIATDAWREDADHDQA